MLKIFQGFQEYSNFLITLTRQSYDFFMDYASDVLFFLMFYVAKHIFEQ